MINEQKIIALSQSENWKELKKALQQKKQKLAIELLHIDNPVELEKKKVSALAYDWIIDFVEWFAKKEIIKKTNEERLNGLGNIPDSL